MDNVALCSYLAYKNPLGTVSVSINLKDTFYMFTVYTSSFNFFILLQIGLKYVDPQVPHHHYNFMTWVSWEKEGMGGEWEGDGRGVSANPHPTHTYF